MNIFVTSQSPNESAIHLPDKHVVKMPLETCQMLSIVASRWYHNYGPLYKVDDTSYRTEKGAFRNHPCTKWGAQTIDNAYWLIQHGLSLCREYTFRYKKVHSCQRTLEKAVKLFPTGETDKATSFARAMPDEYKLDDTIDTFTAYKRYIASKPWASTNYLRAPERRPEWI